MADGAMIRGTTPPLTVFLKENDLTLDRVDDLEFILCQGDKIKNPREYKELVRYMEDCTLDREHNSVTYFLTEEDTLYFRAGEPLLYQARFKVGNRLVASLEYTIRVQRLLVDRPFRSAST